MQNRFVRCASFRRRGRRGRGPVAFVDEYGPEGFTFYTNYESRKGLELAVNLEPPPFSFGPTWSGRCASKATSRNSRRRPPTPITAGAPTRVNWPLGHRNRVNRSTHAEPSRIAWKRYSRSTPPAKSPGRLTGEAIDWSRAPSCFGRAGLTDSMTASCTKKTRRVSGRPVGWRPELGTGKKTAASVVQSWLR